MLSSIRNLFRASESAPPAAVPAGERVYAVGDIHGRADLLVALAEAVEADNAAREAAESTVVLLGDLIDRGPDSAAVIELARIWQAGRPVRILMGNHEEMFLQSFDNPETLRHFLRYGGRETVLSYPIDPDVYARAPFEGVLDLMRAAVPQADLDFIRAFEDQIAIGDYLFVHAGIRPNVALEHQRPSDLRWIRSTFLDHSASFGPTVVHGHTICEAPDVRHNRIGIDTGAYLSGRLTALGLEGEARWLIEAQDTGDGIAVTHRSI